MRIYEVIIFGDVYGYFKSFEKAKEHLKKILRDRVYTDEKEECQLLRICKEIDEFGYAIEEEIDIHTIVVDMED